MYSSPISYYSYLFAFQRYLLSDSSLLRFQYKYNEISPSKIIYFNYLYRIVVGTPNM